MSFYNIPTKGPVNVGRHFAFLRSILIEDALTFGNLTKPVDRGRMRREENYMCHGLDFWPLGILDCSMSAKHSHLTQYDSKCITIY